MISKKLFKSFGLALIAISIICWLSYVPYLVFYQLAKLDEGSTIFCGFLWIIFWIVVIINLTLEE